MPLLSPLYRWQSCVVVVQSLIVSYSLWAHGLKHARPPCPSSSPGVCPSSCPLYWWCSPAISSSVAVVVFCLQFFLASGSFPVSQLFISGGQSIGASAFILPMNIQGWFPLGLTGLIFLLSKGCWRVFSSTEPVKFLSGAGMAINSWSLMCSLLKNLLDFALFVFHV